MMIPPEAQAWAKSGNVLIAATVYDAIQPSQIDPDVKITAPELFAEVNGQSNKSKAQPPVPISTTTAVLVGQGIDPQNWIQIKSLIHCVSK